MMILGKSFIWICVIVQEKEKMDPGFVFIVIPCFFLMDESPLGLEGSFNLSGYLVAVSHLRFKC